MASYKSSRIWGSLKVDEITDTSTGKMQLYSSQGKLLAESTDSNWTITDSELFTQLYNSSLSGTEQLTVDQFTEKFYLEGVPLFNEDRALILNDTTKYESPLQAETLQTYYSTEKMIPYVVNPTTGQVVNNDGTVTDFNPYAAQPQFLSDGAVNSFLPDSAFPLTASANFGVDPAGETSIPLTNDSDGIKPDQTKAAAQASSVKELRYPLANLQELGFDYIRISAYKYTAPGADKGTDIFAGENAAADLISSSGVGRLGDPQGSVLLPMQPSIQENTNVKWGADELNAIQGKLAAAAGNAIGSLGNLDFTGAATGFVGDISAAAQELAADPGMAPFIKAYFAGQAVGRNIVARATGQVLNPNMELLFQGPTLRTVNFNFKLCPRELDEASMCRSIIKFFKKNMAPATSNGSVFLYTPNIFTLEYIFGDTDAQHPFLPKFKPVALQSFNVNYTPDNNYMTHPDGSMTAYNMDLTFTELEPIYQGDQLAEEGALNMGY